MEIHGSGIFTRVDYVQVVALHICPNKKASNPVRIGGPSN
ncbi:hypothetical protein HMPREF9104_00027 [Lentilactobacillus kisonensis F0435]|uniref:Uncharacterized protein n=1 Tax=Lentilactobacillus kisonensis F0435 TaxID=797516 RepID=H1LBR7_9LACO|nr:hypothetical protein HMPREF9104_00027 [Lentilactobacillus kisonensis F0435]